MAFIAVTFDVRSKNNGCFIIIIDFAVWSTCMFWLTNSNTVTVYVHVSTSVCLFTE